MKPIQLLTLVIATAITVASCNQQPDKKMQATNATDKCTDTCCKKPESNKLVCKLTSPELRERKATELASLKKQVLEKKELKNGYSFRFAGNDKTIDELTDFIKSERQCCGFFTFNLQLTGDTSAVWLTLTGPQDAKNFISDEMNL